LEEGVTGTGFQVAIAARYFSLLAGISMCGAEVPVRPVKERLG